MNIEQVLSRIDSLAQPKGFTSSIEAIDNKKLLARLATSRGRQFAFVIDEQNAKDEVTLDAYALDIIKSISEAAKSYEEFDLQRQSAEAYLKEKLSAHNIQFELSEMCGQISLNLTLENSETHDKTYGLVKPAFGAKLDETTLDKMIAEAIQMMPILEKRGPLKEFKFGAEKK